MGSVIHGKSHKPIKYFRKQAAAMAVYWIYLARTNRDNVAWPSIEGLAHDTGWSINPCRKAREWLVEHNALERVDDYVRPTWRKLPLAERTRKINFDKAEYYRPTGIIEIEGTTYPMLYFGGNEPSEIDEPEPLPDVSPDDGSGKDEGAAPDVSPGDISEVSDVSPGDISPGLISDAVQHAQNESELDSTNQDDSIEEKDNTKTTTTAPEQSVEGRSPVTGDDNTPASSSGSDNQSQSRKIDYSKVTKADCLNAYIENINPKISPLESENVSEIFDEAIKAFSAGHVYLSIEIAVQSNKRFLGYIRGIFQQWHRQGGPPPLPDTGQTDPDNRTHDQWVANAKSSPYANYYANQV